MNVHGTGHELAACTSCSHHHLRERHGTGRLLPCGRCGGAMIAAELLVDADQLAGTGYGRQLADQGAGLLLVGLPYASADVEQLLDAPIAATIAEAAAAIADQHAAGEQLLDALHDADDAAGLLAGAQRERQLGAAA